MIRIFYKLFGSVRTVPLLCAMLLIAGITPSHAARAADDLYTIDGVQVDMSAESAAKARDLAIQEAMKQAFVQLSTRLSATPTEAARITPPDPAILSTLVQNFQVRNERLTEVRYVATFLIRFKAGAVKRYLANSGAQVTEVRSQPVLILPYWQTGQGGATTLWNGDNPWLAAWMRATGTEGLVPVRLPLGDLNDVQDVQETQPLSQSEEGLSKVRERYGAGNVAIAIASGSAGAGVTIQLYRVDPGQEPRFVQTLNIDALTGEETLAATLDRATGSVTATLQKPSLPEPISPAPLMTPTQNTTLPQGPLNLAPEAAAQSLPIKARFASMREWLSMQAALKGTRGVTQLRVSSLRAQEADLDLSFSGKIEDLIAALSAGGYELRTPTTPNGGWTLQRQQAGGFYYSR